MRNTPIANRAARGVLIVAIAMATAALGAESGQAGTPADQTLSEKPFMNMQQALSAKQLAIGPIAAFAATGDMAGLKTALSQGLDAGLTVGDAKEVLVQLYAYAGFPRSLNALGELMKLVQDRKAGGIDDAPGVAPSPVPKGDELMKVGTANQTKLAGAPVQGPLFDFAPVANDFLRAHLFGDIFARDNLDWQSRELATVAMLAAMQGVESQLDSHIGISLNTGLTEAQLRQFIALLGERVDTEAGQRANAALNKQLAARAKH
ncbi:carboxymuconolactone decarboxylase family protein [Stenotrophomonas sp. 3(2025)]|uniref:carboxymuconolactone decarboxylase family protein n=1 Tax=Stenotrophomonas sp. 3(2025) TaxID=3456023 RepID=UPI004043AB91